MEKQLTKKEIEQWKQKAQKWDNLDEKISKFYIDHDGNPRDDYEDQDSMGALTEIGEIAAIAFGYL